MPMLGGELRIMMYQVVEPLDQVPGHFMISRMTIELSNPSAVISVSQHKKGLGYLPS
jgi:hypothetical protein